MKGLQVAPAELEALLLTHPAVADAAVIGRPDARAGELPVAYVVARGALEPDALVGWIAERVAPHKRLATWCWWRRLRRPLRASCCAVCCARRTPSE